jgi:hypothetical protein
MDCVMRKNRSKHNPYNDDLLRKQPNPNIRVWKAMLLLKNAKRCRYLTPGLNRNEFPIKK